MKSSRFWHRDDKRAKGNMGEKPYAVMDCETDPFKAGEKVTPYMWGFYDGLDYRDFWGDDCTDQLLSYLDTIEPMQIFAHNGGRFDFLFFHRYFRGSPFIINGRVVDIDFGKHKLSDSFARIPVGLGKFDGAKIDFDPKWHHRSVREKRRREIVEYNRQDCVGLYGVLAGAFAQFGREYTTMASRAFTLGNAAARTCSPLGNRVYAKLDPASDAFLRQFYYGGRVQLFEKGVIQTDLLSIDANSMYPSVMCNYEHPIGDLTQYVDCDIERCDFAIFEGASAGALPLVRGDKLDFPNAAARFSATGHEIRAGMALGRIRVDRVLWSRRCKYHINFAEYIEPLYRERLVWKQRAIENKTTGLYPEASMMDEFSKLKMNSYYGKFGMNPRKYREFCFVGPDEAAPETVNEACSLCHGARTYRGNRCDNCAGTGRFTATWNLYGGGNHHRLYAREIDAARGFKNVGIAASITGAARSELLRGLAMADRPLYCDTDSITSNDVASDILDKPKTEGGIVIPQLGKWKVEATGTRIALAAKKVYAIFDDAPATAKISAKRMAAYGDKACVKLACKGVRLTAPEIVRVAMGEIVTWANDAPTFRFQTGDQTFLSRRVGLNPPAFVAPFPEPLSPGARLETL